MKINLNYTKRIIMTLIVILMMSTCVSFPMKTTGSDEPDFKEMADQLIVLVNEARAEAGLNPVYAVPYLNDLAYVRSRECIAYFSHERLDGSMFSDMIDENLIPWERSYENLAAGMGDIEATFNQWKSSPKHWSAIMNPDVTHMGAGVSYEPNSQYGWYWEQLFVKVWDDVESLPGQYYPDKYRIVPKSAGDMSGDSTLDIFDLTMINQYIAGEITLNPLQLENADLFKDGIVNEVDAMCLNAYLLGQVDHLPITTEEFIALISSKLK
ncbi:MAG: SCP-like extracellular [Ruminococcus sp.]|nr:SCP-like extracellular [Ruminococcus sp.]